MLRGDGRLNFSLAVSDDDEKAPQDQCGVFGVWAPGEEVAKLTFFGLYSLQHRGQESAGIATSNGEKILVYKDMGLVSQVFSESALESLVGHIAVGHNRYSTTGASSWRNAQPTLGRTASGTVALAHNGNLTNTADLLQLLAERYPDQKTNEITSGNTTDTAVLTALLAGDLDHTLEATALELLPKVKGAFCLVFMDESTLYAARDPQGVRPLVLGRLERGWVVASETAALDIVGASFVREVEPGELIAIDENGLRSSRFAEVKRAGCVFEYVYLARPDTTINGKNVYEARVAMGRTLAREYPVDADLVIPTPESGTPAAIGFSQESGIPFGHGLVKNSYVGRTFIQPSQTIRQRGIRLKLNPLREVIRGKKIVVVDDSIVRGNTQRALVQMLREAGLPYVVVLTHPTTGGVTASYAMLGDVQIAEPNALICFAGPRVIEQTIREKLPEGFQRAEYLLDHGMLDRVTHRKEMRDELATIVRMLQGMAPAVKGDLPSPDGKVAAKA